RRPCGRWCCRSTVRTTSSLSPEATRLVDDEAELVDIELDRNAVAGRDVGVPPVVGREALVATGGDVDGECLHVDGDDPHLRSQRSGCVRCSVWSPSTSTTTRGG